MNKGKIKENSYDWIFICLIFLFIFFYKVLVDITCIIKMLPQFGTLTQSFFSDCWIQYGNAIMLSGALLIVFCLVILLSQRYIYKTNYFEIKIFIRIGSLIILLIGFSILVYVFVANFLRVIRDSSFSTLKELYKIYLFEFSPKVINSYASLIFIICSSTFAILIIKKIVGSLVKIHWMNPRKSNILLYLRNFKFDEYDKEIVEELNKVADKRELLLLKIGDPSKFGIFNNSCDVFYLPTTNWKKCLDKQIKQAKIVFSVIDTTQGVFWEIFNHPEYIRKYVFYVSSNEISKKIISSPVFKIEVENKNIVALALQEIISLEKEADKFIFYIRNGICIYHSCSKSQTLDIISIFENMLNFEMSITNDQILSKQTSETEYLHFIKIFKAVKSINTIDKNDNVAITNLLNGANEFYKDELYFAAFKRYKELAMLEVPEAQFMLGRCYELGHGCSENLEIAQLWYNKAKGNGYTQN